MHSLLYITFKIEHLQNVQLPIPNWNLFSMGLLTIPFKAI